MIRENIKELNFNFREKRVHSYEEREKKREKTAHTLK